MQVGIQVLSKFPPDRPARHHPYAAQQGGAADVGRRRHPRIPNDGSGRSLQDLGHATVRQSIAVSPPPLNLKGRNDMSANANPSEKPAAGWRLKLGAALFGLSILLPVIGVPLVTALGLSTTMTASISGALLVGAEVLGVCAVAVMGKSGYAFIKNRVFGFLKQHGPPQKVSRGRYNIGLVIFCVPFLFGWLSLYISKWVPAPLCNRRRHPDLGQFAHSWRRLLGQDPFAVHS